MDDYVHDQFVKTAMYEKCVDAKILEKKEKNILNKCLVIGLFTFSLDATYSLHSCLLSL